jgi:Secretion system C-terminal sorting domain
MPIFFIKFVKEKIDMQYSTFITHHLQLNTLANSCPYLAGNAVLKARAFYANFVPNIFYDDVAVCNALGVYKTTHDSTDYEKEEALLNADLNNKQVEVSENMVNVYPNPASDQITIEYNMPTASIGKFVILDILGNIVQQIELNGDVKRVTSSLNKISRGLYMYQYIVDNQVIYNGKLVIK